MNIRYALFGIALTLAACGGGGGTSPGGSPGGSVIPTTTPTTTPTNTPATTVAGTVVQIPSDAYGPVTMGSATYASADATQTTPLVGATVVIGPVPVTGATPPATTPSGDVTVTTSSTGAFSATVASAPAAPTSAEPFVIPSNNILAITPPTGYYVEVFGVGANGTSAGVPIPLHRFVAAGTSIALRVSSTTSAEAGALTALNSDRAANGAGALTFDESAEEVARLHASDEAANGYYCHYDTHNVGPSSRYLAAGGVGLTGEALASNAGPANASAAFALAEAGFMAEKTETPPGGHYTNLVDGAHLWAGLAVATVPSTSLPEYLIDYDLVTPSAQDSVVGSSGYPIANTCPAGITVNNS